MASEDFFEYAPTKKEKIQMRNVVKKPSEWLQLLCKEWVSENVKIVNVMDSKFLEYKPYTKGLLSSQLLCRLSIPSSMGDLSDSNASRTSRDFWQTLGVNDSFDRSYIMAQVERFCFLYGMRDFPVEDNDSEVTEYSGNESSESVMLTDSCDDFVSLDHNHAGVATIAPIDMIEKSKGAVASAFDEDSRSISIALEGDSNDVDMSATAEKDCHKVSTLARERKLIEREARAVQKAAVRAIRQSSRGDRRQQRLTIRTQRELYAKQQKDAALKRAAELVESDRVPIEIIRGQASKKSAQAMAYRDAGTEYQRDGASKRSAIVVSTAGELHQIVTHSNNLWAKYSEIAKKHKQKVSWSLVASQLGIHVKVREKYARMYAAAEKRGFNWIQNAHWKIRDHPEIFLTGAEEAWSVKGKISGNGSSQRSVSLETPSLHAKSEVTSSVSMDVHDDSISVVTTEPLSKGPES